MAPCGSGSSAARSPVGHSVGSPSAIHQPSSTAHHCPGRSSTFQPRTRTLATFDPSSPPSPSPSSPRPCRPYLPLLFQSTTERLTKVVLSCCAGGRLHLRSRLQIACTVVPSVYRNFSQQPTDLPTILDPTLLYSSPQLRRRTSALGQERANISHQPLQYLHRISSIIRPRHQRRPSARPTPSWPTIVKTPVPDPITRSTAIPPAVTVTATDNEMPPSPTSSAPPRPPADRTP